jgi:hypothetical protein
MMEQGARHREVGEVFGVDHKIITRAWARFQQHGTPVKTAEDRFLFIQARRNRFATATKLCSDLQNASGMCVSTQPYVHVCMKVVCDREDHV